MRDDALRRRRSGLIVLVLSAVLAVGIGGVIAEQRQAEIHRVVFQINSDDIGAMRHAVSNSINLVTYYREIHEPIKVEIVAYGRGIDMFRADVSPLRPVLKFMHAHFREISFAVCGNTKAIMEKQEGRPLAFIEGTRVVPFGIVRLVQLQEAGWAYLRP